MMIVGLSLSETNNITDNSQIKEKLNFDEWLELKYM